MTIVEHVSALLMEAAKGVDDLAELDLTIQVERTGGEVWVRILKDGEVQTTRDPVYGFLAMKDAPFSGYEGSSGECLGAYVVTLTSATKGWGPLIYDVAMEYAASKRKALAPDRWSVSSDAKRVWKYFSSRRSDVKTIQLDDLKNTLTPTPKDNCRQDSARRFPRDVVSQAFYRSSTPKLKKLRSMGLLDT